MLRTRCLLGSWQDVLPKMAPESVDLVLSDPPYATTGNKWDAPVDLGELWRALDRVTKPNAAVVFTASQPFTAELVLSNKAHFRHEWIWLKNNGSNFLNTVREPMKQHESILVFSRAKWTYNRILEERSENGKKGIGKTFNTGFAGANYGHFKPRTNKVRPELRVPKSYQSFDIERGFHPTQKPVALFEYLMHTYSNEGDTVLDPFAGSMTTAVAALRCGRNAVCVEREEDYYWPALERVNKERAAKTLALWG